LTFGNQFGQLRAALARFVTTLRARLRSRPSGAVGVVVDQHGAIRGRTSTPSRIPGRPPRLHTPGSPWTRGTAACAWEGFGGTRQQALARANRLRRRHLRLIPTMLDDGPDLRFRANTPP
jgi:hypothetical protein